MSSFDWWKSGTKGDIAASGLGYAAGFAVDVFLFPLGVPPGTTAAVFAVGAVGAKNAVQAWKARSQSSDRKLAKRTGEFLHLIEAERKASDTDTSRIDPIFDSVKRDLELWKRGILSNDQFEAALDDAVKRYRRLSEVSS